MASTFPAFQPYATGDPNNPSSPSALLLPPLSPTSPTILLSQASCDEDTTTPGQESANQVPRTTETERPKRKVPCCSKQLFTCLVIFLPIAIPSVVYLKEVDPLKRILEPAFVIFITVLFTFSVVFIIRILGEASVAYWGSSPPTEDGQPRSSISNRSNSSARSSARSISRSNYNNQQTFFPDDHQLLGRSNSSGSANHHYYYHHQYAHHHHPHQPTSNQRLTVQYHFPPGTPTPIVPVASPNLSNVSFRYGRPSCRRGIRRARTPSPLYLHRSAHHSINVSPLRVRSSPSSPLYSRLPNNYHFLTNITSINAVTTKLDDPPPPYEKALQCPLAPVSPISTGSDKFFSSDRHSRSAEDVAITINDEAPPPSYDAKTMKL